MSVFKDYARYYDLLYRDKPYQQEADYVHDLVLAQLPRARSVVELGCGTGVHAEYLARRGMQVDAVDMSEWMLGRAQSRRTRLPSELAERLRFSTGDVRTVRLGVRADVVVSLFHVMSYQCENADVAATFATACEHLQPGGVFIFDVWYGPAVLAQRPSVRVKTFEDDAMQFTRIAEPILYPERNVVDVQYRILATHKAGGTLAETRETHRMRYFFSPEIEYFAAQAGMRVVSSHEWMTSRQPSFDTWGVCFICRA